MKTVSDQIKYEKKYVSEDAERYYRKQDTFRAKQLGDQADAANFVIRSGVLDVALLLEQIAERKTRGVGGKYNQLLKRVAARPNGKGEVFYDYGAIAYLGLQAVFQLMTNNGNVTWNHAAHTIAARIEADHKARLFELHEPAYFNKVMKSFDEQLVQQYQHKHRVIMMKFNEFDIKWNDWGAQEKINIANKVLACILHTLPDVFFRNIQKKRNTQVVTIETTPDADVWFGEFERERGFLRPTHPPMLVQPIPWSQDEDGTVTGGYYWHTMAATLPFVKTHSDTHKEFIKRHSLDNHIRAINKMQATPWKINKQVLEVQQKMFSLQLGNGLPRYEPREVPGFPEHIAPIDQAHWTESMIDEVHTWKVAAKRIHMNNKMQKGKVLAYKMIADTARTVADLDRFYFAYNCDFRGRVYCATTGLSPQGEDLAKSLLQFAEGVPHGETGLYWLAIHGANTYGLDKVSNEARVDWVYENTDLFRRIASDALSTREIWGAADKPWQFLSFVFAWAGTNYGTDTSALGYIPVGLDGSCNGLQHYSAMLRDSVGGRAVNLVDSEVPRDIYGEVADELHRNLSISEPEDAELFQREWLNSGFDRKLTKRPVMTLPYGSTKQSAKEYIFDWLIDHREKFSGDDSMLYKYAIWLTPYLWDSIGKVVIAARTGMDWLQKAARLRLMAVEEPIHWTSPSGFPVYQDYRKRRTVRVETMLAGSINARIRTNTQIDTDEIDKRRQKQGVAPNFVHSIDSSHMVATINETNFPAYAMIHDDFGTHAGNTEDLWTAIRESFVHLYETHDPLAEWLAEQELDIDLPPSGDLNIRDVLTSTYFFG